MPEGEQFVWEAKSTDVSVEDGEILQRLFDDRLDIGAESGKIVIQAKNPDDASELEKFMEAAILFQKRRVRT